MAQRTFPIGIGAPLLALVILGGCTSSGAGNTTGTVSRTGALPPPQVLAATPNATQVEYRVGPLDLIEVAVFQVPDLSKTMKVSASGEIAMPLIGVVQAGGKTVAELETEIKGKLEAKYLQSAQVSVFVKEANSQQVTVDGAVNTPGGTLLVVEAGQTRRGVTRAALKRLHFARAQMVGALLSKFNARDVGHTYGYGYGYGYGDTDYYGYGSETVPQLEEAVAAENTEEPARRQGAA